MYKGFFQKCKADIVTNFSWLYEYSNSFHKRDNR